MNNQARTMRLFVNGKDAGPVEDVTFSFEGRGDPTLDNIDVDDPVGIKGQPRGSLFACSEKTTRLAGGATTTRITVSTMMVGYCARSLRRFIRGVSRASTPYAKGRGLKKPRGRKGKARVRAMWLRETERHAIERFRVEHMIEMANALGVTPMLVAEDGRVTIVEPKGKPS